MSMFRNANTMYDREFFSDVDAGSLPSARVVVPMVVELVHPRSVIDVGCARGAWLRAFEESGVDDVLGVDGDYVDCDALWIDREKFVACDLPSPLGVRRVFDLALCLEVAEHLSARKGKDLIRMLCSLAPAVLFSAAVPGQGGTNHVNEQWPGYWSNLFSRQGFVRLDPIRRRIFQNPSVCSFYQQNMFLYSSERLIESSLPLREELRQATENCTEVILSQVLSEYTTVRGLLRQAWAAAKRNARRRFWG